MRRRVSVEAAESAEGEDVRRLTKRVEDLTTEIDLLHAQIVILRKRIEPSGTASASVAGTWLRHVLRPTFLTLVGRLRRPTRSDRSVAVGRLNQMLQSDRAHGKGLDTSAE